MKFVTLEVSKMKRFLCLACLLVSSASFAVIPVMLPYTVSPESGHYLYTSSITPTVAPNGPTGFGWIILAMCLRGPRRSKTLLLRPRLRRAGGLFGITTRAFRRVRSTI